MRRPRSSRTYAEQLWQIVEDVGLRGESKEIVADSETTARSMRSTYHNFKRSVRSEHDALLPKRLKQNVPLSAWDQRTVDVCQYIDQVVCQVEGCQVRFIPRGETKMAKMFEGARTIGKAPSAAAEEEALRESGKALFEELYGKHQPNGEK